MKKINLQTISQGLRDLFYIWARELRVMRRDMGVLIFFIVVPLLYPLLYGYIYNAEQVREVPTVVVDDSHSSLSRDYLRRVDATPEVSIVAQCADLAEAQRLMREREAYGIIYIPQDFSECVATGRQAKVSLYCDMSGLLYYKGILLSNTLVSLEMNGEIKIARSSSTTARTDELVAYPIAYEEVPLYNPTIGFATFLLPAVLVLMLQQTLLLGIGLSAGTAREHSRWGDLIPEDRHYRGTLRIVAGKGLSYLTIYALVAVYVLWCVPRLFSLVQIGQWQEIALFVLPYLLSSIFFSMTLSVFVRNRETCMLLFVFTSVPLIFISGISWPGASVPAFWHYVSYLFPSTLGINGFVKLNNMGSSLSQVSGEYLGLWLQSFIYLITTCLVYYRQRIISHHHRIAARQS